MADRLINTKRISLILLLYVLTLTACSLSVTEQASTADPEYTQAPLEPGADEWSLWTGGTRLRGANTWQRIVIPELDGPEFLGSGYIGPPYTQQDFNTLASLGANYVNLSHPGLFTERPPYVLDEQVQANLDHLIEMAVEADLFVVITFRTGPGRSDFTFYRDGAGDWFDPDLLIEWVWQDREAQDAWVEMWTYTAERYKDQPVVIGYDLLCEPNSNDVILGTYEPDEFYPEYAGSLYDWNQFYPRLVEGIRSVDTETPILVGAMSWSNLRWLPYLQPIDARKLVYTAHQYEPQSEFTHQDPPATNSFPGFFDLDWDGIPDSFDRQWLADYLSILSDYKESHGVAVAVNEFGVLRWVPGAAGFIQAEMEIFEEVGLNHALWVWNPEWEPWSSSVSGMNFRYGTDPENTAPVDNDLQDVILSFWAHNSLRPSNFLP